MRGSGKRGVGVLTVRVFLEFCCARPWFVGLQKGYEFTRHMDQGLMVMDTVLELVFY